jgi:YVTN family beta-propeller protein
MHFAKNFRVYFLLAVLGIAGLIILLREHRPSFLRPGLRLYAYVTSDDGTLTSIDLVKLQAFSRMYVGPGLSGMREHPTRAEIWGASSKGGYLWILNTRINQITARIPVGAMPYAIDFSPDGDRVYTSSSSTNQLIAVDCQTHAILGRARTGVEPVLARVTPNGKSILVVNKSEATLGIHDAATLTARTTVGVVTQPEDVVVTPDSSLAFVLSRTEHRLSVVDLVRGVLLTNLDLAGRPTQMLLKPDGGELYVLSPEAHGLQAINTWTHELGDYMVLGSAPSSGVLTSDAGLLYVADSSANRAMSVDVANRRIIRGDTGREILIPVGQAPSVMRFDPGENLLLVTNGGSGDLSVIRVRTNTLVTMIPAGEHPRDLAVKLF